jgi:Holliday junction resolvase RusA-like endonuclease
MGNMANIKTTGNYYLRIELVGLPTGGNSRQHWRAKYNENKKWKNRIFKAIGSDKPTEPLKKVKLEYERYSSSRMDWDNLVISFKPIQDGLVEYGIIEDDKIKNIPEMPKYSQYDSKRGEGKIVIIVKEYTDAMESN